MVLTQKQVQFALNVYGDSLSALSSLGDSPSQCRAGLTTWLNKILSFQPYHSILGCTSRMSEEHCPGKVSSPWAVGSQAKSKFNL